MATPKQIAQWRAEPRPYCLTIYDRDAMRSRISGKRRFATVDEALAAIKRSSRPFGFYMVDYAGALA